jgi:SET domain-containing protein
MLRVKTYLDKSPIHGIGVFAAQEIQDGVLVWTFEPQIDKVLDIDESTLKYQYFLDREFIRTYAYFDKQLNKYILSVDNDRFINHSDNPNTIPLPTGEVVADRDIHIGEEITINYFAIDTYAEEKLHGLKSDVK